MSNGLRTAAIWHRWTYSMLRIERNIFTDNTQVSDNLKLYTSAEIAQIDQETVDEVP